MNDRFDDDSTAFAQIERQFVRDVVGVADFGWVSFDHPSPRNPLTVPLAEATVTLISTAGAHLPDERLFERAVPSAIERIHDEQAHLALLVPA